MNSCLNMAPNTSSLNMDPMTAFQSHDSFEETADQFSNAELNSETILNYSLSRSAYDEATLSNTNGSDSIDTFYDASTTVNSCMHNASISPLMAQENLLNLGLSGKGLHIGHLNIQGIRSGEKVDQIKIIVVTHRLGSGTGSGCKYRELVSEVRQGAVLNLRISAAHAQNSRLPVARGLNW